MQFRSHTLDNGLEIVAECNDQAYSAAVGFFVRTGSRDETAPIAGVSHFLEHMMFKGTPTRSADDVNREFDEMGAQANAFTNEETTVYHAAILPEFLDETIELLADMMRPSLREEDFEMEKQVIIEEILMYEDMPPFGADERCRALHYNKHPLANSVLGTTESIEALSADAMRDYFKQRYSPNNIVLAGAGRIDFDQLIETTRRHCGDWCPIDAPRTLIKPKTTPTYELLHKESSTQQYVLQLADGPDAKDEDRFPAKLLATILGDDSGSRLYWELIDPGLAEHVSIGHYEYDDAGMFFTYLSCEPEQTSDNMHRITDLYLKARTDGVTQQELDQARSKVCSRIVLGSERPRGRLFAIGSDRIMRTKYRSVRDDLDLVRGLTVDDIHRVLEKYPLNVCTTMAVGPLDQLAINEPDT